MDLLNNLKKCVASVALATMGLMAFGPVANAAVNLGFVDDAEIQSIFGEAIEELMDQGVIHGNDDGTFAPNRQLNRAEVSKIIVLATGVDFDTTGGPHFPDVQPDAWYYDYIETMYNYGWINGYPDGLFRPGVGINRAEIAKMVINAFEVEQDLSGAPHFDDVSDDGEWYYGYVETAYNNGLIRGYGDGTFGPANAVTRAETVKIVYDAQLLYVIPMGPASGTLEVMLSYDTPRGTNIPFNATSVPYTTVELTAADDTDVEVSSITFTRIGLGDNDDFDNVWLEIDGFKVGNDKSINNDDIVELRFNPPIVVPAGQTIVADVVASSKYSATDKNVGHHNRLALVTADDIVSSALNIVGDFPIEGEEMEIADYEVSQLVLSPLGVSENATIIDVGDNFIEIGKFRMVNDSNTNKDVELRAITFKNNGSAEIEDDLENVGLYVAGEQVSAETIMDGDYITFRLDNGVTGGYVVEDGDSRIFSIRADIVSAEKDDTIEFKVDNFEDIVGVEIGTSFGVKAVAENGNPAEDEDATLKQYQIDSGDLNVSRDPASMGNQQYAPGSNDVVAMTARLVVDQPLLVDGVKIYVATGSNVLDNTEDTNTTDNDLADFNATFDNFRLFLNDKLLDSENDFTLRSSGADGTVTDYMLDFNTTFEIAGTSILKVVANIQDGAVTTSELKLRLAATDFLSPEYISTGDSVDTEELLGSATSSIVEVMSSTLDIVRIDGFSNGNKIVAGVDDVTLLEFLLDNNDSGDVEITGIDIKAIGNGPATTYSNFTAAIFVNGKQEVSAKNLSSNGTASFNDLTVVIPSAGQVEFVVVVDTIEAAADGNPGATTLANGAGADYVVLNALGAATDCVGATLAGTIPAGSRVFCVANGLASYVPTGTMVAISADGKPTGSNAELKEVVLATDSYSGSGSTLVTRVEVADDFVNEHNTQFASTIIKQYPIGTCTINVVDTTNFEVNDWFNFGTADTAGPHEVTVVSATSGAGTITFSPCTADAHNVGEAITESNTSSNIRFIVTGIQADNIENGQTIEVYQGGSLLSESVDNTAANEDCSIETVEANALLEGPIGNTNETNYLCGARFALVESGHLQVSVDEVNYSDIIVAGEGSEKEILKIQLQASDDIINLKGLYLINDVVMDGVPDNLDAGSKVDFKLYNSEGELIDKKRMIEGRITFDDGLEGKISVPKDDSTFLSIKVEVSDFDNIANSGQRLRLALDDSNLTHGGVMAVSDSSNNDIDFVEHGSWGDAVGKDFVLYNSEISVRHAESQPKFEGPATDHQDFYRFVVSADVQDDIAMGALTFKASFQGLNRSGGDFTDADFKVYELKDDGHPDTTVEAATITLTDTGVDTATLRLTDFVNKKVSRGSSKSFVLQVKGLYSPTDVENDDAVSVLILNDTTYQPLGTLATVEATDASIVWSDYSATTHSVSTADWTNGYLVEVTSTAQVNSDN